MKNFLRATLSLALLIAGPSISFAQNKIGVPSGQICADLFIVPPNNSLLDAMLGSNTAKEVQGIFGLGNSKLIYPKLDVAPAKQKKDTPFGDFLSDGKPFQYNQISNLLKGITQAENRMYFGIHPKSKDPQSEDHSVSPEYMNQKRGVIQTYFSEGVNRSGGHLDVYKHQLSTSDSRNSGFSIYTPSIVVAGVFATLDGIIFAFDVRGLELLSLTKFSHHLQQLTFESEAEFVSKGGRNPKRVMAAITRGPDNQIHIYFNPNYEEPPILNQIAAHRFLAPDQNVETWIASPGMKAWRKAISYIESLAPTTRLTPELAQTLNSISLEGQKLVFKGYARNMAGTLRTEQQSRLMALAQGGDWKQIEAEFQIPSPVGRLRTMGKLGFNTARSPDTLPESGETAASSYFSEAQIQALRNNPYLKVGKTESVGNHQYKAEFFYPDGEVVLEMLNRALIKSATESKDIDARYFDEPALKRKYLIRAAAELYYAVVSIHPFWDGNGRTAKLIRDFFLLSNKIAPPAWTPVNDMELSIDALADQLTRAIEETERFFLDGRLGFAD